jgi:gliding motility-associated-like protein
MKRGFLIFLGIFFLALSIRATHLVGGEMSYECLGNGEYKIILKVYRDCGPNNSNGTGFDPSAAVGIFEGGALISTIYMSHQTPNQVPLNTNDPCVSAPNWLCIEEAIYESIVTLNNNAIGYDIVYQRCCRNPNINNIVNPQDYGITLHAKIPGANNVGCNSSPSFTNYPPMVLCTNQPFNFDHSALDVDGDQLTYEFCTPYHGGTATNPAPDPPTGIPFSNIVWAAGFSQTNQITGNPTFSIDPATGVITGTPTANGLYVLGVCVKEFRNGNLLSETKRDIQLYVQPCNPNITADINSQGNMCQGQDNVCDGMTVKFCNNSTNSSFYEWNFGDGNLSTQTSPSHTYAGPGTYTIQLVANPGFSCADTTSTTYEVKEPLNITLPHEDPQCEINNSFDFSTSGNFDNNTATINWDFGSFATPSNSNAVSPTNIVFSDSGHYTVSLTISDYGCTETLTDEIVVFPEVEINFDYPPQEGCAPYTMQFTDATISWTPVGYLWDFGDGSFSTDKNPYHTYENVGTYDVVLNIETDSGCIANRTLSKPGIINVNPTPRANFTITPKYTHAYDPKFRVRNRATGETSGIYVLTTGDEFDYRDELLFIDDTGSIGITQVVQNDFGCSHQYSDTIYIEPITTVYVPNAFSPNGDYLNESFGPIGRDVIEFDFKIFNRWGDRIFESTDISNQWDGQIAGKPARQDIYVYSLVYKTVKNKVYKSNGHFSLIR